MKFVGVLRLVVGDGLRFSGLCTVKSTNYLLLNYYNFTRVEKLNIFFISLVDSENLKTGKNVKNRRSVLILKEP